jgi:hypothetical protein
VQERERVEQRKEESFVVVARIPRLRVSMQIEAKSTTNFRGRTVWISRGVLLFVCTKIEEV